MPRVRDEPGVDPAQLADRAEVSSVSTASSGPKPTSGIRISSMTTTPSTRPHRPRRATTSREDITDKALEFIKDAKVIAPRQALLLVLRARGGPRPAPRAQGVDRQVQRPLRHGVRGHTRDQTLARQKEMGIVPPDTELSPLNPIGTPRLAPDPMASRFPPLDMVRPWDSLVRGREAPVLPDGRGVRRIPGPRRRPDRSLARLPGGDRPARKHHSHRGLGQRGQR